MSSRTVAGLAAALLLLLAAAILPLAGCGSGAAPAVGGGGVASGSGAPAPPAPPPGNAGATSTGQAAGTPQIRSDGPGFYSRERLEEHYAKHGREFGDISVDEYLRLAQRLRDAAVGGDILELRRADGFARFDRATGAFGAYNDDRTIRTFFRPRDGESYFRRQARRHGE